MDDRKQEWREAINSLAIGPNSMFRFGVKPDRFIPTDRHGNEVCTHRPHRLHAWHATDGTLCIACNDCGKVLAGA